MQSLRQVAGIVVRVARLQTTAAATSASSSAVKAAPATSRRMKYPYTMTAKIVQFPYKFHWQNFWLVRYYFCGGLVIYFVFMVLPIHRAVNSPAAVAAHKERMRKQAEEERQHHH
uniref:Putative conserved plasma membrane protein n=1 Tax=Amblyomma tuberculatum TaxID=48802 RepID=A0A6M2E1N1_9ACAR